VGIVKVNWDVKSSKIYEGQKHQDQNGNDVIGVDLNCFDPDTNLHRYLWLEIPYVSTAAVASGDNVSSATFKVYGLSSGGSYMIDLWNLRQGFEQQNKWQKFQISTTPIVVEFNPFSGKIIGQLSNGTTDFSNFKVSYSKLWDWGFPEMDPVTVSTTGYFEITGLPTGEYVLTIAEEPISGDFAVVSKRARVASGKTTDLGTIFLPTPGTITGRLILNSSKYADWNVVAATSQASGFGMPVVKALNIGGMMQMGSDSAVDSAVFAPVNISTSDPTIATFEIKGLSAGNYIILPPTFFDSSNDESTNWGEGVMDQDLACSFPFIPLAEGATKDIGDIDMTDGYDVKFTVSRSETGVEQHFMAELQDRECFMPVTPGKPINFSMDPQTGNDYTNSRTRSIKFASIYPGKYNLIIRIWDQTYKDEVVPFEVTDKGVDLGTINLSKGANIKGKVVDAETGEVVYKEVKVRCEARPWIEGSWRETANYNDEWADDDIKLSSSTGQFKLKNLPAGTYRVWVEDENDEKPYKYAPVTIEGVLVPDDSTDVDVGTIKLKKGKNISGIIKDIQGKPLANIKVEAEPMSGQIQTWSYSWTDGEGKFVLKGLDPDVEYWKIIAAPRPDVWERDEDASYYVEAIKRNVQIGEENLEITLSTPNAQVIGVIQGPVANSKDDYEIVGPFEEDGIKQFGAMVVLQRKGEVYDDPLAGYQVMSEPPYWDDTEKRWKTDFKITGLRDGIYNLRVMAKGFTSVFVSGINISSGENNLGTIDLSTGATLTGTFYNPDMSKVKTTEVEEIVAATPDLSEIVFGKLISNDSTKEIEGFEIQGLRAGTKYAIVLSKEDDLFFAPDMQYIKSSNQVYSPNGYFIYQDNAPFFTSSVNKVSTNTVKIQAWITDPIRETDGADVLILDEVNGSTVAASSRDFDWITISPDKIHIEAEFTFASGEDNIKFHYEGTDYNGNKQEPSNYDSGQYPFEFTYYKGWDKVVQGKVNSLTGGTVEVGEGDDTNLYFPAGSISGSEECKVEIVKTTTETLPSPSLKGTIKAARVSALKRVYGYAVGSLGAPPENAKGIVSELYTITPRLISGPLATIAAGQSVQLTLSYDPTQVSVSTMLYVASSSDRDGDGVADSDWTISDVTPQIDTENHTVTVEVNHFSQYAVWELSAVPSGTQSNPQIVSVSPSSGKQGETIPQITITGSDFASGASVSFSPSIGITVTSSTVSGNNIYVYNVKISSTASTGSYNITVTNPDGAYDTLADAFIVSDKDISITQVSDDGTNFAPSIEVTVGNKTLTLTITGTGLNVFGDNSSDYVKLDNKDEKHSITGSITNSTDTSITATFAVTDSDPLGTYDLILYDADNDNYATLSGAVVFTVSPYSGELKTYVYPNPVTNGTAYIKVAIPSDSTTFGDAVKAKVRIYNLAGEEVWSRTETLYKGYGPGEEASHSGKNTIEWDCTSNGGEKIASGAYFYIVETENRKLKGKIAVIR